MRSATAITSAIALARASVAAPVTAQDTKTANVYFSQLNGSPQHLASGILYGVPDQPDQVQDHWYTDMGFNYLRAGGAQTAAPGRGWIWGLDEYKSVLSNYHTARKYDAKFVFLIHDLWGADGGQNKSAPFPGDNGDWTFWDNYVSQLVSDMKANDMIDGVLVDLWNEPDNSDFWNRTQDQYLQYWGRSYYQFRDAFGSQIPLTGPAASREPHVDDTWWNAYLPYISHNASIPDQWVWHMESGSGDMLESTAGLNQLLSTYSLPQRQININEYAVNREQVPSGSTWWISQLERVNAIGLRGNWLSANQLHDFLASLLSKPNAENETLYDYRSSDYFANGDYQVYKYYNLNMTGSRVGTTPSADGYLDAYATFGEGKARVLSGVRVANGTWNLQLNDLASLGLPTSGNVEVQTWAFEVDPSDIHFGRIDGPTNLGTKEYSYEGGVLVLPIVQTDNNTAHAFEIDVQVGGLSN